MKDVRKDLFSHFKESIDKQELFDKEEQSIDLSNSDQECDCRIGFRVI